MKSTKKGRKHIQRGRNKEIEKTQIRDIDMKEGEQGIYLIE